MAEVSNETELLVTSTNTLQKILNAACEGIIVVDANIRITHYNVPATLAFGREGLELESKLLSEVIRDVEVHQACRRAVSAQLSGDVRLELPTKEKRNFNVHIAPFELNGEKHAISFFYETTHIDRLETVRQEFLSNISHELRTPLTSIMAFVETLEDGGIDDKENNRRFLQVIRRNAERMNSLIADILELSMIESGNVELSISKIPLNAVVQHVFSALSTEAANRNVELRNQVPADTTICADSVRLEQMLTNLVDNAIKFNRKNGIVKVEFSNEAGQGVISVSDTGEGILPDHAARIFERFYRADRSRTREVGGTGLGLAIVKHLARLHGGEVTVSSSVGSGTTFRIELPSILSTAASTG